MTIPPNPSLRQRLRAGETVVGRGSNSGRPIVAELLAACGCDFLCVDVAHSAVDVPQAQQLFQAIRPGRPHCAALVPLHGVDWALVKPYLEAGACGVVAPLIRTPAEAALPVLAAKYPPQDLRAVGFCRATACGVRLTHEFAQAKDNILLAVQIEQIVAVRNFDALLSVPGIDAACIGPYNLAASRKITAQGDPPDYLAARDAVPTAPRRHHVAPRIHVVPPDPAQPEARIAGGYRFLAYSLDITMLTTAGTAGLSALRKNPA